MSSIILSIILFLNINLKTEDFTSNIVKSIQIGNAYETNQYFNKTIELRIDSENINYKKTEIPQATEILKIFFKKYPASDFKIYQKGNLSYGGSYYIGNYLATSGHQFNIYIIAKKNVNQQIMIEKLQIRNLKKGF